MKGKKEGGGRKGRRKEKRKDMDMLWRNFRKTNFTSTEMAFINKNGKWEGLLRVGVKWIFLMGVQRFYSLWKQFSSLRSSWELGLMNQSPLQTLYTLSLNKFYFRILYTDRRLTLTVSVLCLSAFLCSLVLSTQKPALYSQLLVTACHTADRWIYGIHPIWDEQILGITWDFKVQSQLQTGSMGCNLSTLRHPGKPATGKPNGAEQEVQKPLPLDPSPSGSPSGGSAYCPFVIASSTHKIKGFVYSWNS